MNQLSIDFAVRQGQRGMTQAQVRAEHAQPGFTYDAAGWILRYLREHGPLPGEMLTDLAKAAGHVPPDDRAFGCFGCSPSAARSGRRAGASGARATVAVEVWCGKRHEPLPAPHR